MPCVYCRSDNVIGLALVRDALAERAPVAALASLAPARTEGRHQLRWSPRLSAGLLAYSVLYLAHLVAGQLTSR